jgi:hypothetical protein
MSKPASTPASKPVRLPPELNTCVNAFLAQANELQKGNAYDAVSASMLYAAARYNVHGYVNQDGETSYSRADFVAYMVDLYKRMLEEQIDVLGRAAKESAK